MNLYETDAEFMERFERFAFTEIVNENGVKLSDETRYMSILASLIGCQGVDAYKVILAKALDSGLSPFVIKEIVYQSVDYLGMGRIWPFLVATNVVMEAKGIDLPLIDPAAKTNRIEAAKQERLEKDTEHPADSTESTVEAAEQAQEKDTLREEEDFIGEQMKEVWKDSHINKWLEENLFGDKYPGNRLPLAKRELLTFCFLYSQGGCDMQVVAHAKGNMKLGNDKELLMRVISQSLPYIGYPRCLNAVNCVNEAERQMEQDA